MYDASTNLLTGVLTCPECPVVLSAQFVGRSSRYLAAYSPRDLVLWDVITQTGVSLFLYTRSRVVANPTF